MTSLLDRLRGQDAAAGDASPVRADVPTGGADPAAGSPPHADRDRPDQATDDRSGAWRPTATASSDGSAEPMSFTYPAGSTPLPPYTIRRGIGTGGFGEVYFAVSEAGKEVALKRIQRNLEVELRGVSQCLNLKHPHLVSLFDICHDTDGQAWVVMEYVAGVNLRDALDEAPDGLPEAEVHRWFTAIASGVGHLHSSGLVHRDLKPGNVFDDAGIIKVGDYGLTKFISASHRSGHTESVGTFHYMAPEIGRGQYGREIDIYAMGVLLYELLTGRVPFDGESCHEIIIKHLTATPDLSDVEQPYRGVIAAALEKDPSRRPSSAGEMLAKLGLTGSGGPFLAGNQADSASRESARAAPSQPQATGGREEQPLEARLASQQPRSSTARSTPEAGSSFPAGSAATAIGPASSDEPIARAVRESMRDLNRWWAGLDRSPGAKVFLAIATGYLLVMNSAWLLPVLSLAGALYVTYYVIRLLALQSRPQPSYAEAHRLANAGRHPCRPVSQAQLRSQLRAGLRSKRPLDRLAELSTSWLAAIFTVAVLLPIAAVVGLREEPVDATALAPYVAIAVTVLLASLLILAVGKHWERAEGEGLMRRLVLGILGAALGLAAFALSRFLMIPLDEGLARSIEATELPSALYSAGGVPGAAALAAHFALLLALLRWWKPVDPLRRTRLSLWAVAVAVVAEWCLHQVLPVPQPGGMLIAGGIAVAAQLAAPWINPKASAERRRRPSDHRADARVVA